MERKGISNITSKVKASFYIFIITGLILFLPGTLLPFEINIKLVPEDLLPGDAFFMEVKSKDVPSGEFDSSQLHFYPVSNGIYQAISSVRIDMKPGEYQLLIIAGNASIKYTVKVYEKKFPVSVLNLKPDKVFLSPENEERVKKENIRLSALWSEFTEPLWNGVFIPPLNASVSTQFGVIRIMNEKKESIHKGTDYIATSGESIRAINSGKVVLTDELFYGGNTVVINHGGGIYSVYMHLSKFIVKEGEKVGKNDIIGNVGSTGRVTGPHLHLSVKVQGRSVNPESMFSLPLAQY